MHKIIKTFKSRKKIIKLKDIMKAVYSAASNQIADIAKLNLKKALIPHQVERAEIEIKSLTHKELITVPKNSLTFLSGTELPFTIIDNDSNLAGEYIVLPWELNSREGKDILKNIIKKIPFIPQSLTYTLYINLEENTNPVPQANQDITQALSVVTQSVEDYSWSDDSFTEDNVEGLLQEIERLKKEIEVAQNNYNNAKNDVTAKTTQITNLQAQVNNLNSQITSLRNTNNNLQNQVSNQNWTIFIPSYINGNLTGGAGLNCSPMSRTNVNYSATIDNVVGNVVLNIANRSLTIGGNSCGSVDAR
ncbi:MULTISPECIES: hypothetical protein [unclassified Rickettsia]|uniref:coiled-coil domain-containing protein n=1 Tax=unclassified Rickettsia TaxID=114295 RepID=UPI003132C031